MGEGDIRLLRSSVSFERLTFATATTPERCRAPIPRKRDKAAPISL
jgi:hypothetical protein